MARTGPGLEMGDRDNQQWIDVMFIQYELEVMKSHDDDNLSVQSWVSCM